MKCRLTTTPFPDLLQAALLEFVGTAFFLTLGLGGIQAAACLREEPPALNIEQTIYIATCMGFSLLVSAWMFYRVTGALFNPNISLALLIVGVIDPARFIMYCIAQLLGAIAASGIVVGLSNAPLAVKYVTLHSFLSLSCSRLTSSLCSTVLTDTTYAKGVFIEMFITAALVLAGPSLIISNLSPYSRQVPFYSAHASCGETRGDAFCTCESYNIISDRLLNDHINQDWNRPHAVRCSSVRLLLSFKWSSV